MNRVKDQLNVLKNWINTASALIREFRINDNCFTRTGKISHQQLLLYGLVNAPGATSENLVDLYLKLGVSAEEIPTKQALSQKRKLINEQPFCLAYKNMVSDLYRPENRKELKTFNGFFTVGIDGSDIAVPNNPSLKEIFGTVGRGGLSVTARGSVALDLLNRAPLDGLLAPVKEGERELMKEHLKDLSELIPAEETLYIMDRGYFSADLFEVIDTAGAKFLIRCPVGTCHAIDDAATEDFVSLENNQVVKVFKLVLDSGEIEVLATNLFDLDELDAYDLYHLRWNIEENFKIIKSHLHLECFNGCSETVVRQEFYAVLINNLLLSAVAEQADQQVKQKKKNRYRYQANRNRCAQAIRRNLVALLTETDEETIEKIYDGMFRHALRDTVPVRPGRNTPRKNKRAVRFHMNIRYI